MGHIYWVEDEIDLLEGTKKHLEHEGLEVRVISNASKVIRMIDQIKKEPGPIIVDLWIPPGDVPEPNEFPVGPGTGMAILEILGSSLGAGWPIWIVSGNLTYGIKDRLVNKFGIPLDRIYSKPLNARNASLVAGIVDTLRSTVFLSPG